MTTLITGGEALRDNPNNGCGGDYFSSAFRIVSFDHDYMVVQLSLVKMLCHVIPVKSLVL